MNGYLLDTNICIFYLKGRFDLETKVEKAGWENCFISEITVAELKFGAASSDNPVKRKPVIEDFIKKVQILPIYSTLDLYAEEKTRLRKAGNIIDDFDLLIGCTAIFNDLLMVTNNVAHLSRVAGIQIEDWTKA
jgi:tRNA(fMet)-specific endonuclease VapC